MEKAAKAERAMRLRPTTMDDVELLLNWRNDPATREASINIDVVSIETHVSWLKATLVNPKLKLLIAEKDVPVGTVRITEDEEGIELSWTVAPEARGKGYGTEMVRLALPKTGRVIARIKRDNRASQKIARAVGLSLVTDGDLQRWQREAG